MTFLRLSSLADLPQSLRGAYVAIGNFDGLHRGHQTIIEALRQRAQDANVPALMLTFEPHPRDVFAPAPFMFRLTQGDAKARLAEALGLDGIVILPFDHAFSQTEAEDFVETILVEQLGVRGVITGSDFHFGRQRRGTRAFLKAAGDRLGFAVETLDLMDEGDEPISSSRIRAALSEGAVTAANRLLGYHWFFDGCVVQGDQRGRDLGFPTANTMTPAGFQLAQGVYAVRARLGSRRFDGVAAYGKPMFDNQRPPFETHLFDFDEDIYGQTLQVALVGHIRGQEVFSGLDELIAAMNRDAGKARDLIAADAPVSDLDRKLGFFE
ncbi:bifunctional riboflavin kinase/FAD synthetase [Devosia sp. YIM 151766]|uniref:bifunctional riboflavin kinase/FAD synthetase n=1 Tax=Devosia sp. YIM 151766 TaxID=3017325 RepID=UPI00255C5A41|nr:bifunctional riboflavin kinase/FAD synthetase [Devosia sp. YIM 151766]WIY53421.1 bifunctional riboflavin kinase/FAD synthetase [Devosia sp. YIM 151766]